MTTYAASKAALEAHTLNLAAELRGTGVTANVYRPGTGDTSMQAWIRKQSPDRIGQALQRRFAANHVDGALISAAESARSLLTHLRGNGSGEIWTVADAGRREPARTRRGRTCPSITATPVGGAPLGLRDALGALVNEEPTYLQSAGFVLGPDGRVTVSIYSSGAVGRLVPDDVIGLVRRPGPAEA